MCLGVSCIKWGKTREKSSTHNGKCVNTIQRLDWGESIKEIALELGVGKSTVVDWKRTEVK